MRRRPDPDESATNACDWGRCDREPEPTGSAFCVLHAEEWERVQQARNDEWWAAS